MCFEDILVLILSAIIPKEARATFSCSIHFGQKPFFPRDLWVPCRIQVFGTSTFLVCLVSIYPELKASKQLGRGACFFAGGCGQTSVGAEILWICQRGPCLIFLRCPCLEAYWCWLYCRNGKFSIITKSRNLSELVNLESCVENDSPLILGHFLAPKFEKKLWIRKT